MMTTREKLLTKIEAFLRRTGMGAGTFGTRAVNDGKFVTRLRSGGEVQSSVIDKSENFMRDWRRPEKGKRAIRFRKESVAA